MSISESNQRHKLITWCYYLINTYVSALSNIGFQFCDKLFQMCMYCDIFIYIYMFNINMWGFFGITCGTATPCTHPTLHPAPSEIHRSPLHHTGLGYSEEPRINPLPCSNISRDWTFLHYYKQSLSHGLAIPIFWYLHCLGYNYSDIT